MTGYHNIINSFENALKESSKELQEMGFANAQDIVAKKDTVTYHLFTKISKEQKSAKIYKKTKEDQYDDSCKC